MNGPHVQPPPWDSSYLFIGIFGEFLPDESRCYSESCNVLSSDTRREEHSWPHSPQHTLNGMPPLPWRWAVKAATDHVMTREEQSP